MIIQYAVLGPYDFVTVIEAPDNSTAALLSVDLGSRGTVEIVTLPAVSVDDLEARIHHAEPMRGIPGGLMTDARVEFRRFHHVTIAVDDLDAAVNDWTERLSWPPSTRSSQSATFALDDSYIELVPAGAGTSGIRSVSVVVDDVAEAAARLKAKGASIAVDAQGHVSLDPAAINGVAMELRPEDASGTRSAGPQGPSGAYRRFDHLVVAVSDDEAAAACWAQLFGSWIEDPGHTVEAVHHVPVGIAWFGLTGSGTDADALARFVERRGEGIYALAVVVDDRAATLDTLEKNGAQIIRQESSGQTFVHPKTSHGVLIDLVAERRPL